MPSRGWPGAVEFRETASGLEVDISMDDTPEAARAVEDIRARRLTGFSVEFTRAVSSVANGIREVKEAVLIGIGVVEVAAIPIPPCSFAGPEPASGLLDALAVVETDGGGPRRSWPCNRRAGYRNRVGGATRICAAFRSRKRARGFIPDAWPPRRSKAQAF